ncbi:MAG: hypothetical protein CMK59_03310 [Proteobacteria bacterium]|nr:hypothetical protein [Pseudomonadota bacterium]
MRFSHSCFLLTLLGCVDSSPKDTATEQEPVVEDSIDCPQGWTQQGDLWLDPILCAAWSPPSDDLYTWYEAISTQEASQGGCSQVCDNDTETNYCADLELNDLEWRLPTDLELEGLSTRTPPFADIYVGYTWTIKSDAMEELAWTVDLSQEGMSIAQSKTNPLYVYCIAD